MSIRVLRWLIFLTFVGSIMVAIATDVARGLIEDRQQLSQEAQINEVVLMVLDVASGNMTNESAARFVQEFKVARHFNDADKDLLNVLHDLGLAIMSGATAAQMWMVVAENRKDKSR